MRLTSLQWILTACLAGLSFGFLGLYMALELKTIRTDKQILFAKERGQAVDAQAKRLAQEIAAVLVDARTIVKEGTAAASLFWEHPQIMSVELRRAGRPPLTLEKDKDLTALTRSLDPAAGHPAFLTDDGRRVALGVIDVQDGVPSDLRVVFDLRQNLDQWLPIMALHDGARVLWQKEGPKAESPVETLTAPIGFGSLQMSAVLTESEISGDLRPFLRRTLYYLLFALFGSYAAAAWMSRWATQVVQRFPSAGEALSLNENHIQRESPREIRQLVAQRFFPASSYYENGSVRLWGHTEAGLSSTDWWYYEQRDHELFVLVTECGETDPAAALTTAAARATFSSGLKSGGDLKNLMNQLQRTVMEEMQSPSELKALILKIHVELGEGRWVNAGFQNPLLIRRAAAGSTSDFVGGRQSEPLRSKASVWAEELISLKPDDKLILFSKGLLNLAVDENRLAEDAQEIVTANSPPDAIGRNLTQHFLAKNGDKPSPSDVTLVILDYRAARART